MVLYCTCYRDLCLALMCVVALCVVLEDTLEVAKQFELEMRMFVVMVP
jgi:hypothetical protein